MADQVCSESRSHLISNVIDEYWKEPLIKMTSIPVLQYAEFYCWPRPIATKMRRKVCFFLSTVLEQWLLTSGPRDGIIVALVTCWVEVCTFS